jgi:hypothetical protein
VTPAVGFDRSTAEATEGQGPIQAAVSLSQPTSNTVSVMYAVTGSAQPGNDYTLPNGVMTFSPGQSRNTLAIPVTNDSRSESDETLTITLSNPENAIMGQSVMQITLHDNDAKTNSY